MEENEELSNNDFAPLLDVDARDAGVGDGNTLQGIGNGRILCLLLNEGRLNTRLTVCLKSLNGMAH